MGALKKKYKNFIRSFGREQKALEQVSFVGGVWVHPLPKRKVEYPALASRRVSISEMSSLPEINKLSSVR